MRRALTPQAISYNKVWNWLIVFQIELNYCVAEIAATCEIEMEQE